MRHSETVVEGLDPMSLRDRIRLVGSGVDMDHRLHVAEAGRGQEVLGPVPLSLQGTHGADGIEFTHVRLQPGVVERGLL
jgi:hypothetical protein